MKRALVPIVFVAALAAAATVEFGAVRANLRTQRDAIYAQWNRLAAAFDAHAELVANFAAMVREAASGSKDSSFADIAAARQTLLAANSPQSKIDAYARLVNAFARMFLVARHYPKLTSSAAYGRLKEEIADAESGLALERRKYNDLLEHYNAQLQKFPYNAVGRLSGFARIDAYVKTEQGLPY